MACEFTGDKPALQAFVLNVLSHLNGRNIVPADDLRGGLGYDNEGVRTVGQAILSLVAEHDCNVSWPNDGDYDNCKTVAQLIDLIFGRIS